MGFVSGFTGGVTLTLSVAYLSALAHRRNREHQAQVLRAQALSLQDVVDPIGEPLPPTRSEIAAAQRATSVEVAKDRWNHEVENAIRWVQHTDWTQVREGVEDSVGRAWSRVTGEPISESAAEARSVIRQRAHEARLEARAKAQEAASAARGALSDAKSTGRDLETRAEDKLLEGRLAATRTATRTEEIAEDKATEAKGALASLVEKGQDKAKDLMGKAKSTVGAAESALQNATTATTAGPVQKALNQRYERSRNNMDRSVAEVLQDRYRPIDQLDNTNLRGL